MLLRRYTIVVADRQTGVTRRFTFRVRPLVLAAVGAFALPVALGFGISRPEHVAEVTAYADAAVVGSALVSLIGEERGSPALIDRVEEYVRWLKGEPTTVKRAEHARIS